MVKRVVSFGEKYGRPPATDGLVLVDVRLNLRQNPWYVPSLRGLTGLDIRVGQWLNADGRMPSVVDSYVRMAQKLSDDHELWFYCTGGHHRSVYVAERVAQALGLEAAHRDIYMN
jgi:UPF0042 nucleotide-binding protein